MTIAGGRRRVRWNNFALRAPVFALGAVRRAHWNTFVLRTPVFALGAVRRAHGTPEDSSTTQPR